MTATRIGYSLGPLLSTHEVIACAKMADSHQNVDSIWVPESWGRESFATLGAMSQITKRVRLGTSIISIYSRTPATVAMAATTLDMLSNNRTIIGLGPSTAAIVENWHGLKFERPASRMREYVECLKLMASGEKVNYNGKFFRANNFRILHQPLRKHIPIFMGAVNKKMVSLASEIADGVLLYLRPLDELKKTVADLKRSTKDRSFEVASSFICALSNKEPEKARERAAKTLAFYVAVGKYYSKFLSENGFRNEVESITVEYGKGGADVAAKFVSDRMLDSLVICGDGDECRKALVRCVSAGITLPIIQMNPVGDSESSFREMLSTF
ncbi:MAG TPA: LLM class flavin-dependent oxidoreductase [Nitrososphaera sp.]|jgi:alkanesulfonate monooxygenase SsuD/methylene tetrahydromethanopterin reductase-like flavin-dependent oxidoreductase (luciferase family)|nr:LLM class flavin-dependent oxidoreductase [Nitrososphaera sp.]